MMIGYFIIHHDTLKAVPDVRTVSVQVSVGLRFREGSEEEETL